MQRGADLERRSQSVSLMPAERIFATLIAATLTFAFMGFATMAQAQRVQVERVKDGDTFVIVGRKVFGEDTSVRVLGFDTPEKRFPEAKCELEVTHAKKASDHATGLVAASGGYVWLQRAKGPKRDLYGRHLFNAYLRINGKRVSWRDAMIEAGYAKAYAKNAKGLLIKPDWCMILGAK